MFVIIDAESGMLRVIESPGVRRQKYRLFIEYDAEY